MEISFLRPLACWVLKEFKTEEYTALDYSAQNILLDVVLYIKSFYMVHISIRFTFELPYIMEMVDLFFNAFTHMYESNDLVCPSNILLM